MLRRSAWGMKRSVFAGACAQPAPGAASSAIPTSAPAKRNFAAIPGIDPPVRPVLSNRAYAIPLVKRKVSRAPRPRGSRKGRAEGPSPQPSSGNRGEGGYGVKRREAFERSEVEKGLARVGGGQVCGRLPRHPNGGARRADSPGGDSLSRLRGRAEQQQPPAGVVDRLG